ncbi:unnamed protein product [Lathyrus oleraceus]|uniref:Uncharacterized protein n=1 Tax=Pisum sativum TaxID=3888 RepID=A0A9D4YNQ6_PEA|nr:hypothetical protein KIW84_011164 [Pisum sativum]
MFLSIKAMDGKENSKVHYQQKLQHFEEKEKYTSSCFSYPSFNNQCHVFSTMECNELNNAKVEAERESSFSLTPIEEESIESSSSSNAMDEEEEEVSLDELFLDGETKKKIELLAAMVGVDTNEPTIVLREVVRVLKVLKTIGHY